MSTENLLKFITKSSKNWSPDDFNDLKIEECSCPTTGRGMQAKTEISKGDVLISIPKELAITALKIRYADSSLLILYEGGNTIQKSDKISYRELFIWFLVYEKRNKRSEYKIFIESLPSSYENPVFWSDEDVKKLPNDSQVRVNSEKAKFKSSYRRLNTVLKRNQLDLISENEFEWAYGSLMTRCFYWGNPESRSEMAEVNHPSILPSPDSSYAMVPLVDMLNHHCIKGLGSTAELNKSNNRFEIKTNSSYNIGEQVFISYGSHSSIFLIENYGFLNTDCFNAEDVIKVNFQEIDTLLAKKHDTSAIEQFLQENYLHDGWTIAVADGFSWSLQKSLYFCFCAERLDMEDMDNYNYVNDLRQLSQMEAEILEKVGRSLLSMYKEKYERKFENASQAYLNDSSYVNFLIKSLHKSFWQITNKVAERSRIFD